MPSGGINVEMAGMMETIGAVRNVAAELRPEVNSKLRAAAKECAAPLAAELVRAASASGVPVAPKVAASIKVKSDRIPVVAIGGGKVGPLVWGSEQGPKSDPNRFAVAPNSGGYWIAPTVARFADGPALGKFQRAVYEILHDVGLV
jgi:hypothetical protein